MKYRVKVRTERTEYFVFLLDAENKEDAENQAIVEAFSSATFVPTEIECIDAIETIDNEELMHVS